MHSLCVIQKQSDLLLNADDLDAMWVCLRENCVIDDATGAEKVCIFCAYVCSPLSPLVFLCFFGFVFYSHGHSDAYVNLFVIDEL